MADVHRRRRRVRHQADEAPERPPVPTPPRADPEPAVRRRPPEPRRDDDEDGLERGLRGLVGTGNSQVNVAAAMRARDAARPTDEDLAAVERELTIVRRHWAPRD